MQNSDKTFIRYPRVLVLAPEPFNQERGCGITLSNLFKGWPKEKMLGISWQDIEPDSSVCETQIHLQEKYFFRALQSSRKKSCGEDQNKLRSNGAAAEDKGSSMSTFIRTLVRRGIQHTGLAPILSSVTLTRAAIRRIREFDPQIMYCPINNRNALILAHKIMKVVNMPVISHVYDDWISFLDKREGRGIARLVGRLIRKRTEARLRKILTMSKLRMTIGDEMSKQYSSRYNLDFLTFQNAPDPEVWLTNGKKDWSRKNPFIIRFTGTAYDKGNLQALVSFAEAVEATTNQGLPILLEIYTTKDAIEKFASLFDKFTKTVLLQTVSESVQMAKLYGSADALLIAYNFEDNSIKWLGMSMPTKLPTYLLSGTPTIVYAPQKTAVTSFFRESGCGYVISSRCNSTDLSRMILDFIENEEMRKQFGLRSREIAINKFSARVIRPMFHDALIKTAIR